MGLKREAGLAREARLTRERRHYRAADLGPTCPACSLGVPRAIDATYHPTCGPDAAALLALDAEAATAYRRQVRAQLAADLADPPAAHARAVASVRAALAQATDSHG